MTMFAGGLARLLLFAGMTETMRGTSLASISRTSRFSSCNRAVRRGLLREDGWRFVRPLGLLPVNQRCQSNMCYALLCLGGRPEGAARPYREPNDGVRTEQSIDVFFFKSFGTFRSIFLKSET